MALHETTSMSQVCYAIPSSIRGLAIRSAQGCFQQLVRLFFSLAFIALCPNQLARADQADRADRPTNILWIMVDDLRPSLGCYGDSNAITPNIDRLASESRCFLRAYCQQAVCGPSRASILTGMLPDHTGVWHNRHLFRDAQPKCKTLPELLKDNGYHTQSLGKIFSGDARECDPPSWSVPEVLRPKGAKNYLLEENQGKGKQSPIEFADRSDDAYPDGKLANQAIETLRQLKKDGNPFFLAVGFFRPHLPFTAPEKYLKLHSIKKFADPLFQRAQGAPEEAYPDHLELAGYEDIPQDERIDGAQAMRLRQAYYACVSYVDAQVGRLLDALNALDLDDNTIVVLMGDHGYSLGEADHWCKATNFELDTRVPLIIRKPHITDPGVPTSALVESVDLYPTLLDLLKLKSPNRLDGESLLELLNNPKAQGKPAVLSQFARPFKPSEPSLMGYSLRTANMRYTRWVDWETKQIKSEELYQYGGLDEHSSTENRFTEHAFVEKKNILNQHPELAAQMRDALTEMLDRRIAKVSTIDASPTRTQKKKNP